MNSNTLFNSIQYKRFSRLWLAALVLLSTVLFGTQLKADQGRNFAGFYAFSDVREVGFEVSLTLHLQLFNVGSFDIEAADVTLEDGLVPEELYVELGTLTLFKQEYDQLSSHFYVPAELYDEWQQRPPMIQVWYQDDEGYDRVYPVELMFTPGLEEE